MRKTTKDDKKSVIGYRVPLWFHLENFEYLFGENLTSYHRFSKNGTVEETQTVDLKFFKDTESLDCIQSDKIRLADHPFRVSPNIVAPVKICRVSKTTNTKHRPRSCANIRCGQCSENHVTKDHPTIKCPVCGEAQSFNGCPQRRNASKKAFKGAPKSYKEVLLDQRKQSNNPDIPPPEQLDRLLATPEDGGVLERLSASFLIYLVRAELISKQQNEQIMDFWKSSRDIPRKRHELPMLTQMEVDPEESHLTRRRTEEVQYQ